MTLALRLLQECEDASGYLELTIVYDGVRTTLMASNIECRHQLAGMYRLYRKHGHDFEVWVKGRLVASGSKLNDPFVENCSIYIDR